MATSKRSRILTLIALLVLAQGSLLLLYDWLEGRRSDAREPFLSEPADGQRLPAIALERYGGGMLPAERVRGRPVLLHFWATWCPPCLTELPGLLDFDEEQRELDVIAIALDREWAPVLAFLGGTIPKQVVRDPSGELQQAFEVRTVPASYLLDRNGVARLRFRGARNWTSRAAAKALERQLHLMSTSTGN